MSLNSEDRKVYASRQQRNTSPAVLVAENFYRGAGSVLNVQQNGNGKERSEPIINERIQSRSCKRVSCNAEPVVALVRPVIPIAWNVQRDETNSPIVKGSDGIIKKE